jgi:hypothetical protein
MPAFRDGFSLSLQETLHRAHCFKFMLHIEHDTETVYLGVGHEEEALHLRFLCRSDNLYQLRMLQIIGKVTADKIDNIAS